MRNIKHPLSAVCIILLTFFNSLTGFGQACTSATPSFTVDLTGNPDSVWISSSVVRDGKCCQGSTKSNDPCIEFIVTLDPGAEAIRFNVASGASPSGALEWQLNCGPRYPVNVDICVNDLGPHTITFCKPGNNENTYSITSVSKPSISPPSVATNFCTGTLTVENYDVSTVQWNTVAPGAYGEYNYALSCSTACDSVIVSYIDGLTYIDVEVTGMPTGGCSGSTVTSTTRVYFVDDKDVEIFPKYPTICYGGVATTITASGSGGAPPYSYLWSTGETTAAIDAPAPGWYYVEMSDTTGCPPVHDSVYVNAFMSEIEAYAGLDTVSCANNADVQLNGTVQTVTTGRWSGGSGTYSPNDTTLNAVYTPTAAEITAGTVELILTTIDNGTCPEESDTMLVSIVPTPIVTVGPNQILCENNPAVSLTGTVTNAGGGAWSGGTGTYFPNNTTINTTYTPTATEIANGTGTITLTLTSTDNGTCTPVSASMSVSFTPAPTVNAGLDQTVCGNNANVQLNATYTNATGIIWSGGTGTFSNTAIVNPVYTPSATDIANGTVTLTATTTGNGNCNPVSDNIIITITPAPTVNAGVDRIVCANNASVTLNGSVTVASGVIWSTSGTGTFSSTTALNATYTPSATDTANGFVDLTLTTTGNGTCLAVSDIMRITITPAPVVNAGADRTVCANNVSLALNGSVTVATGGQWSGGTGAFSPGNTTLTATYTPSATEITNGSATLTLTSTGNGTCAAVSDQMIITITSAPTVNAGLDQTVCANNSVVSLNGTYTVAGGVQWSGGAGTFNPGNTDATATYTPTATEITNGSVLLTLTTTGNGLCNAVSDQMLITITPAPTVTAGSDVTVCGNNATVALNGTVTVATGGVWSGGTGIFNPGNTTLNASYSPSATEITAGTVTLTLTTTGNGTCLAVSDAMTITITPATIANAGPDQTVCANNASTILNGSVTIATGGTWSGGTGAFSPNASTLNATYIPSSTDTANGFVDLTLTTTGNGSCLPATDLMRINITPAPIVNAGVDQTVCANNSTVSLNGSITVASGGQWSGGTGTFTPDNTTLNASYVPSATEVSNGSVTLTLTTTGNGTCTPVTDQMIIAITPAPTVNAGLDRTVCANNPATVLNGTITVATGAQWSGGTGTFSPNSTTLNATYTPSATEITNGFADLTLTTTGNGSCLAVSDQMRITITTGPTVNAGMDRTVCANNPTLTLNGTVTIATGGTWSGGTGSFNPGANTLNASYTPSATEITNGSVTLTLTTTGNGNCIAVSDQMIVTITTTPTVYAGTDQSICENNADVSLSGTVTVATGGTWSGGAGTFNPGASALNTVYTPTASEINAGSVNLTLTTTGNGNCTAVTDQMTVIFTPQPVVNAGSDRTSCANNPDVTLAGSVTGAGGGIWSGGGGTFSPSNTTLNATYTPSAAEITNGTVTLTLTSTSNGTCNPVSDAMIITITPAPTANAGTDLFVCANNPTVNLSGAVTIATGGSWITGSGTFVPDRNSLSAQYTPSAAEITSSTAVLVLETTGNGNCLPVRDTMLVIISASPYANAGVDRNICSNNPNISLNGTVANSSGRVWSGGNGSFSPNNSTLNAVYSPTSAEIASGTITLTLTATRASCNAVSDNVTFTFTPTPVVNAGPDQSICSNNADVQLNGSVTVATGGTWSGGSGSFIPAANTLNAVYRPTATEISSGSLTLVLTSTGNGNCIPVTDAMVITFTPAPTVNAGPDQTVCANKSTLSLNGSVTVATGGIWSGGSGIYTQNIATLTATYSPSAADEANGSVWITLTTEGNGNCNPVKDSMLATITPAPTANAGADISICANNAVANLNGSVTVATGGTWNGGNGIFSPDANTLNATYRPTAAEITNGFVNLTLVTTGNGDCNLVTDNLTITITPAPTVNAGTDQSVCGNTTGIPLNGQVTVATGGTWSTAGTGTFSPNANTLNASYIPSADDITNASVTLTLVTTGNGTCSPVTDDMTVIFTPVPWANAGPDQTVCTTDFPVQLNGTGTTSSWSGGNGTFSPNNSTLNATYTPSADEITNQTVTLTLTTTINGSCAAVSDQVTFSLPPGPVVNAGTDIIACGDVPNVTLNGSVLNAGGGLWTTTGAGSFNPGASTLNASYLPGAADIDAGPIRFILTSTGNGACTAITDTMFVTFTEPPVANAGLDRSICADKTSISVNGTVTVATGGTWTTSGDGTFSDPNALSTTYNITPQDTTNGSVTLTLTTTGNGTCNAVSDQILITITDAPLVYAGPDNAICADEASAPLQGSVYIATGGTWTSSGTGAFAPNNALLSTSYYPSAADTTAGTVTFTLTSTGNGTCNAVSDQMVLTITPAPVVNAGPHQTVCADLQNVTLTGATTVATGGTWATSGSGTFTDPNSLSTTYQLSPMDSAGGSVTLTLTSTGNGRCQAYSNQMFISVTPAPTANAGADQTVCANNATVLLNGSVTVATGGTWTTTGTGTFTPDANSLNASYQPSAADTASGSVTLILTTTGNGTCNPVSDEMIVNITPAPITNAGPDQTVCADIAAVQLNGSVTVATGGLWTSSGTGYFTPSDNVLNAQYIPSAQDTTNKSVTITLTSEGNGSCLAVADAMALTITPAPTVSAGSSVTVCGNNSEVTLNGQVTVATGGTWSGGTGTFSPDANTLTATYTPSASEILDEGVTLTLTTTGNGTCNAVTDRMRISITPAPVVNAGPDLNVCENNAVAYLNTTISVAAGGIWSGGAGLFSPSNTSLNASYTLTASEITGGSLDLVLTSTGNGTCLPVTDTVTITVTPAPVVDAGPDQTVCADLVEVQLAGSLTVASGGIWTSNGTGFFTPSSNALTGTYTPSAGDKSAGTVQLTLTSDGNGNCFAVTDQMTITITPAPTVSAGPNQIVCGNNADIQLNGSVTIATGGMWSGGNGTFSPDANTLNAVYSPSSTEISNGTVTLTLTTTGNGTCNPVTDNITTTITPAPVADAGADKAVCENNPVVALSGIIEVATGGVWSNGSGTFNPGASSLNTNYTLTPAEVSAGGLDLILTTTGNGLCLPVTDTVNISVTPSPLVDAGPDQTICADLSTVALNGSVTVATGGIWSSNGTGTFSPNINTLAGSYLPSSADTAAGTVLITLTSDGNGTCLAVTDQMILTITPAPTVNAGPNTSVCADIGSIPLNGSVAVATGGTWSGGTGTFSDPADLNGSYTPTATEIENGTVTLTLTSTGNGTCNPVSDNITYTITPAPTVNAGFDRSICADAGFITLNGDVTIATGGLWSTSGTGTFSPGSTTLDASYLVSAADTASGSVTLTLTTTGNGNCNTYSDDLILTINPAPVVGAGTDKTICADASSVDLSDAFVFNAAGGIWITSGSGTFSPNAYTVDATYIPSLDDKATGTVTLTLTSDGMGTCNAVSDQVTITINPAPTVNAGPDITVCSDVSSVQLNGIVTVATGGVWTTGSGRGAFSPDSVTLNALFIPEQSQKDAGLATLTLTTTGNGLCNAVNDRLFIYFQRMPVVDAGPNNTVCADLATVQLDGTVTNATGGTWTTTGTGTFSDQNAIDPTYSPSSDDRIAGQITLRLTSTGNGECPAIIDSIILKINPLPAADAGPSAICSDAAGVKLDGVVTNASGGAWTTSGTGTFSPTATILNPTFYPSADDVTAGQVMLRFRSTGNGPCAAARDSIVLSITPVPSANAGLDQIVCANTGAVQLNGSVIGATGGNWTSSGGGTFSPSEGTLNAQYTPSAVDILNGRVTLTLTTTGVGLCNPASDRMVITITPAPTANAGPDVTVCADTANIQLDGAVTIATGGQWSSPTGGTFNPDQNTLNAVYIPTAADISNGSVTLTLTTTGNGTCIPVTDNLIVTITPAPTINLGSDLTICGDAPGVMFNGTVTVATGRIWGSSGTGSFSPDNTTRFVSYNFSTQDTIDKSVTVFATTTGNGMCNAVSDTAVITITPAPLIAAAAGNACADDPQIQLTGSFANAGGAGWTTSGDGLFLPDTSTLNAQYEPGATDIANTTVTLYFTTIDNGFCNAVTDSIVLTIAPPPSVSAGPDQTICAANPGINLAGAFANADGIVWSSLGTGTFSNVNDVNATYFASSADTSAGSVQLVATTIISTSCSPVSDTVTVTFVPAPIVDAGPAIICTNDAIIDLSGMVLNATGGEWSTSGDGVFTNITDLEADYTRGINDNTSITITLTSTGNGICSAVSDNIVLNISTAPTVNAGVNDTICADENSVNLNGSWSNAGGVQWSTLGSGTFSDVQLPNADYFPSDADTSAGVVQLVLTTTDNGVCSAVTDTVQLTITPAPVVDAGPASVCANNPPVALNGTVHHATGGMWTTLGDGSFNDATSLTAGYTTGTNDIATGEVKLVLTSTGNGTCNSYTDTLILFIAEPPAPVVGGPYAICADADSVDLNGDVNGIATGGIWTSSGSGTFSDATDLQGAYLPSDADTTAGIVKLYLTTSGNGNCNAVTDSIDLVINPAPIANAGTYQTICADAASVSLNGAVVNATGGTWTTTGTNAPPATLTGSYTISSADTSAGSVTFTLTTTGIGTCNAVTDDIIVTFRKVPIVDAGPGEICANDVGVQLDGTVVNATGGSWITSGDGSFAPNNTTIDAIYVISDNDRLNGSVTLTLRSTGNGACAVQSDAILINITAPPTVTASSESDVLCADGNINLSGTVTGATGSIWTSNGGGIFADELNLNTIYTPSAAEAATTTEITLWFALTTTGTAPCDPVSDTVYITLTPAPIAVVNAGSDTTVCADSPNVPLQGQIMVASGGEWTSSGNGIFSPNAFTLDATYFPDATDISIGSVTLTLTTTGNGLCNPVSDDMIVTYTQRPVADAGDTQTVCADNASIQLAGVVTNATGGTWMSTGSGSFNNANDLNAIYTFSAGDIQDSTLIFTLSTTGNGACNAALDNKTIHIHPVPVVNAGFDQTICADNRTIQLNGTIQYESDAIWSSNGSGSFTPDPNTLNAQYLVSDADTTQGTIIITLTSAGTSGCNPVSDDVALIITDAPTVNPGTPQTVCADVTSIQLEGAVTVGTGGIWESNGTGTFAPDITTLNALYIPSSQDTANGSVTLTLTTTGTGSCSPTSADVTMTITPAPLVIAGADLTACANAPAVTLNGSVVTATGGTWTGGAGSYNPDANTLNVIYTPTPSEINAGIVNLTLTTTGNGTCNAVNDRMSINFTTSPTVNAGTDQTLCANNAEVSLNGAVTVATGGIWSGGAGTFNPDASSLNARYVPTQAEIDAGSLTLTLTTTGNGNCIAVTDNMVITFTDAPIAYAGSDESICADRNQFNIAGSVTVAGGGIWSTSGSGNFSPGTADLNATYQPSASDKSAGVITITLTTTGNGNCHAVSDNLELSITPAPTINAGSDQTVCGNNASVTLNGAVTVATGGTWSGGTGTFFPDANTLNAVYSPSAAEISAGTATLTLTSTGNGTCYAVQDNVSFTITPIPTVHAGDTRIVCANNPTVELQGLVSVSTGGTWSGGSGTFNPDADRLNTLYTPSATEINAGTVTLTLTTTGNGNCIAETSQIDVTITPAPTIDAGADQTICADRSNISLSATATVASGGAWTTSGNGSFAPASTNLSADYYPSLDDRDSGTVTLVVTSTGNGNCLAETDTLQLVINPAPTINAGPNDIVCGNNAEVTLNGSVTIASGATWSGGSGTFTPDANTLNAVYLPSASEITNGSATLILTSTGNGLCNPVSDNMTITITPAPTVNAGMDQTVCANNADLQLSGSITVASGAAWTGGTGSYNASATSLSAIYSPSDIEKSNGTLTLTLTTTGNGDCNAVEDSILVTITPAPVVNAGIDQTVCADIASVQLNGSVSIATGGNWTSSGSGSFIPNASALNAQYVPSSADTAMGSVALTLTSSGNGNCMPVSDYMVLTITPAPIISAGPDQIVCADAESVQLNGSVTVASGGIWNTSGTGTFTPAQNLLKPEYIPGQADIDAGRVILRLYSTGNGTCNSVSDEMVLDITPAPTVNAGIDQLVCADIASIPLNGNVTVATGGNWTAMGTGSFSNANSLNSNYSPSAGDTTNRSVTLILTTTGNGKCKPVMDTVIYSIRPEPIVSTGGARICSDVTGVNLTAFVVNATGVRWETSGSGSFATNEYDLNAAYTPSQADISAGVVTLTLNSEGHGTCLGASIDMQVIITPLPEANAGEDEIICRGDNTMLMAKALEDVDYAWFTDAGAKIGSEGTLYITANTDTTFVLSVTDQKGCTTFDTVTVYVTDPPVLNVPAHYCLTEGLIINGNPSTIPAVGEFQWYRNDTLLYQENNSTHAASDPGLHMFSYSYGSCSVYDTANVTALPYLTGLDKLVCIGDSTNIGTTFIPQASYQWFLNGSPMGTNSDSLAVYASINQEYIVRVTDSLGCVNTDSVILLTMAPPTLTLNDIESCIGLTEVLEGRPSNVNSTDSRYTWFKDGVLLSDTTQTLNVTTDGTYALTYRLQYCYARDTATVIFNPLPVPDNADTSKFCQESDGELILDAGPATAYLWLSTTTTQQTETFTEPGMEYVQLTNQYNCNLIDSIYIKDVCPPRLFIPDAFAPNGNSLDHKFRVFGDHFANFSMTIYNRWGEVIFHTNDYNEGWDGTYLGEPMPAGVYAYILQYAAENFEFKQEQQLNGKVVLVR